VFSSFTPSHRGDSGPPLVCLHGPMIEHALGADWSVDAESIACPARIVWGAADRLLAWPSAAARYRGDWLPQADWSC